MTPNRLRLVALALLAVIVIAAAWFWVANVTAAPSAADRAGQAALAYAKRTTIWNIGPSIRTVRTTRISGLESVLRRTVTAPLAADVNVSDLAHRVGAGEKVALVVLQGTFNTLPPGEGVVVAGDMVAIVDLRNDRVLMLTE